MSYSTCRPNRTVVVKELAQEMTHFFFCGYPHFDVSWLWEKCLLPVWWQAEKRMLHCLKRGRDFHEWSGVTDPRRCVLISVGAPSLHKACISV